MKKFIVIIVAVSLFFASCSKQKNQAKQILEKLTQKEKVILENFFRMFFTDSEGGYVLFGDKPLCTEGIMMPDNVVIMYGNKLHKKSIYLNKGYKVWKKIASDCNQDNFVINYCPNSFKGWDEIRIINKKRFFEEIAKNLSLFQYKLGSDINPKDLFNEFISSKLTTLELLREDKILVGILLGFGLNNSLKGARIENIYEAKNNFKRSFIKKMPIKTSHRTISSSIGYNSLEEELAFLEKGASLSTNNQKGFPVIPLFLLWQTSESKKLIDGYLLTQQKLEKLLKSDNFLEQVINQFINAER